jgi:hypothetical protein
MKSSCHLFAPSFELLEYLADVMSSLASEETVVLYVLNFMVTVTTWRKREVVNWATAGLPSVADMVCRK